MCTRIVNNFTTEQMLPHNLHPWRGLAPTRQRHSRTRPDIDDGGGAPAGMSVPSLASPRAACQMTASSKLPFYVWAKGAGAPGLAAAADALADAALVASTATAGHQHLASPRAVPSCLANCTETNFYKVKTPLAKEREGGGGGGGSGGVCVCVCGGGFWRGPASA